MRAPIAGRAVVRRLPVKERARPHRAFWRRFCATDPSADGRPYDVLRFGETQAAADEAAELVASGRKTVAVTLRATLRATGEAMPEPGRLRVVEDSEGRPVAVVETVEVTIQPLGDIDDRLTRASGKSGGSIKSWRRQCRASFGPQCRALGLVFGEDTELVCEWFRVVFTAEAALPERRRAG